MGMNNSNMQAQLDQDVTLYKYETSDCNGVNIEVHIDNGKCYQMTFDSFPNVKSIKNIETYYDTYVTPKVPRQSKILFYSDENCNDLYLPAIIENRECFGNTDSFKITNNTNQFNVKLWFLLLIIFLLIC